MSAQLESGVWSEDGSDLLSQPVINFFARRRIAISLIGFISLLLVNLLVVGTIPLNPFQLGSLPQVAAVVLLIGGLAIRSWAAGTLNKSRQVTTYGPYAVIRNPLYVGSFMLMTAFCIWLRDLPTFLFVLGPMCLLYRLQVRFEEKRLLFLFPNDWPSYAAQVPRFLPRSLPIQAFRGWTRFEWWRNREYRTILASMAGLGGVYAWHLLCSKLWWQLLTT